MERELVPNMRHPECAPFLWYTLHKCAHHKCTILRHPHPHHPNVNDLYGHQTLGFAVSMWCPHAFFGDKRNCSLPSPNFQAPVLQFSSLRTEMEKLFKTGFSTHFKAFLLNHQRKCRGDTLERKAQFWAWNDRFAWATENCLAFNSVNTGGGVGEGACLRGEVAWSVGSVEAGAETPETLGLENLQIRKCDTLIGVGWVVFLQEMDHLKT